MLQQLRAEVEELEGQKRTIEQAKDQLIEESAVAIGERDD